MPKYVIERDIPGAGNLTADQLKGIWQKTENNRDAKYYAITKSGERALGAETTRWRRLSGLVEKLLTEES
jgi:DNA-binding PadR family transcriptional regulator